MPPPLILALVGVAAVAGYAAECWIWPLGRCRRCDGRGTHQAWWGVQAWRTCRRCNGRGKRFRLGRRIFNYLLRLRKGT